MDLLYFLLVQQSAWTSGALALLGTWLYGNKSRGGPWISLVSEVFWVFLALYTDQPGLLVVTAIFSVVHLRNALLWGRS